MAKLSPVFNDQTIDANGDPYVGAQLFTYVAGSSTKQAVYTDAAGTIPHLNPIELNSLGFPTQGAIWIPEGISVKFVLASPTDTDPPTSPIKTIDNVQGVNDASVSISEWQASGVTPTYISTVSFSLPGDQTTEFQKGRRAQFTTSGGTKYGKIINSVFTTLTTVTMLMDGTDVLDGGLSVVNLSLLRYSPSSLPNPIELLRSTVVANATTTPLWDAAYGEVQDWTGAVTITALPNAPRPGAQRQVYPAAGTIMTNAGNISVQGNANATVAAGDKWIISAITPTSFYVEVIKKDGSSAIPAASSTMQGISYSVAANALTISLPATLIDFPNPSLTNGTPIRVSVPALSIVVPSGASLGSVNGIQMRIIVGYAYNGGTPVVIVSNASNSTPLNEENLISPTTISAGSTSANTIYSASAVGANSSYRITGFLDITEATAGVYATAPTLVRGYGGQILAQLGSIGYNQSVQAVTRTTGMTYYNPGRPFMAYFSGVGGGSIGSLNLNINGSNFNLATVSTGTGYGCSALILANCSYVITDTNIASRASVEIK